MIEFSVVGRYERPLSNRALPIVKDAFEKEGFWDEYVNHKRSPVYGSFWYCVFPSLVNEILAIKGEDATRKFINDLFTKQWREMQDETGKWVVKFQT